MSPGLKHKFTLHFCCLMADITCIAFLLQATFKRYQMEHKMKHDSLERSQSDLKKLRRKSQGKNANKYENKESEVSWTFQTPTDIWHMLYMDVLPLTHTGTFVLYHSPTATSDTIHCKATVNGRWGQCVKRVWVLSSHAGEEQFVSISLLREHTRMQAPPFYTYINTDKHTHCLNYCTV